METDDYFDAIYQLKNALEPSQARPEIEDEQKVFIYNNLGFAYLWAGIYDEAIKSFQNAVDFGSEEAGRNISAAESLRDSIKDRYRWKIVLTMQREPTKIFDASEFPLERDFFC